MQPGNVTPIDLLDVPNLSRYAFSMRVTGEARQGRTTGVPTVALGDNHGCNVDNLFDDLRRVGALLSDMRIDPEFPGILIQVGDTVHRGAYSLEVFNFWRELQVLNPNRVVRLLGNHELYELVGCPQAINSEPVEGLQSMLIDDIMSGNIRAAWYERDVLYSHAGLDLGLFPEYRGRALEEITLDLNQRLLALTNLIDPSLGFQNLELLDQDPIFSAGPRGNGYGGGIFWARHDISNHEFRQVVGHTPQKDGIRESKDGRVKYIDVFRYAFEEKLPEVGRQLALNSLVLR
jgi:hypothetical protein